MSRSSSRLVGAFYASVAADDVLARLYPEAPDLRGAEERLRLFLIQYWGGPTTYSDQRGHPRLRLRHLPFHIGREERDRWLEHMDGRSRWRPPNCPTARSPRPSRAALLGYFHPAAEQMRNDTGLPIGSARR